MKIGYVNSRVDGDFDQDVAFLKRSGCDEVVIDLSGERRKRLADTIERLRPGDTLEALALECLGSSALSLVSVLSRIHDRGAGIDIGSVHDIVRVRHRNGGLLLAAQLMAFEVARRPHRRKFSTEAGSRRGLSDAQINKARELMQDPALTMQEVAAEIGCSVPTLYRARTRIKSEGEGGGEGEGPAPDSIPSGAPGDTHDAHDARDVHDAHGDHDDQSGGEKVL